MILWAFIYLAGTILQAVDRLQARGYTFCTVSELAALRGTALLPGEVYTGFPPLDG